MWVGRDPGWGAAVWNAVPQRGKGGWGGQSQTWQKDKTCSRLWCILFLIQVSGCACEWVKMGGKAHVLVSSCLVHTALVIPI